MKTSRNAYKSELPCSIGFSRIGGVTRKSRKITPEVLKTYTQAHGIILDFISEDDTQLLDGTTILEWKKTRNGDWDWFVCDTTNTELSPIAKVTYREKKVNEIEQKNLKIKSEIMTESYSIMKKYNISDNDIERITKMIVDMIDKELPK